MTSVIEKATSHFRSKIAGEMRKINVPEWECDIYVRNTSTLKDESKILELSSQGKTVEALVETIINKARNEDGTRMFQSADKVVFMNEVDPNVLIRVAGAINGITLETEPLEQVEKN